MMLSSPPYSDKKGNKVSKRLPFVFLLVSSFGAGFWLGVTKSTILSSSARIPLGVDKSMIKSSGRDTTELEIQRRVRKLLEKEVNERIQEELKKIPQCLSSNHNFTNNTVENSVGSKYLQSKEPTKTESQRNKLFPRDTREFLVGATLVDREDFLKKFDTGIPQQWEASNFNRQVYLLYQHKNSLPSDKYETEARLGTISGELSEIPIEDATKNCQSINIVSTKPFEGLHQCMAIVGQYESNHILRYMRSKLGSRVNDSLPFEQVARTRMSDGSQEVTAPSQISQENNWRHLIQYFSKALPQAIKELIPIIDGMTRGTVTNAKSPPAIVTMTCNLGQADLLINFVCTAGSMDLSHVLVFCTDVETLKIAQGLGLNAYYSKMLFGDMPTKAAAAYGDSTFMMMMWGKIVAVHIPLLLGCDVLFQDVDVVWNADQDIHPLDFFRITHHSGAPHSSTSNTSNEAPSNNFADPEGKFDILFSDDGSRAVRFAPYSGNTGFYYVRNNERTIWLLTSLVYLSRDVLMANRSHQEIMILLLAEHSISYALKVKTFSKHPLIMGGFEYHTKTALMKEIYIESSKPKPMVFHMCWTHNRDQKFNFLKQMGFWQVEQQCEEESNRKKILEQDQENFKQNCCAAMPIIQCFYSDKPSIIPCIDSPSLNKKSSAKFWDTEEAKRFASEKNTAKDAQKLS